MTRGKQKQTKILCLQLKNISTCIMVKIDINLSSQLQTCLYDWVSHSHYMINLLSTSEENETHDNSRLLPRFPYVARLLIVRFLMLMFLVLILYTCVLNENCFKYL